MIRLAKENLNTSHEYNQIFQARQEIDANWQDLRRWKKLLRFFRGGNLLDVGCLDSNIPVTAMALYPNTQAWGIDIAWESIRTMSRKFPEVNYEVQDLYKMKFKDGFFDYVVLGEVLEHLESPQDAIRESVRVLKPKGVLSISVPLNEAKEPGACDGARHLWSIDTNDMLQLLRPHGKVKVEILGSKYFPKYQYAWPSLICFCRKK